MQNLNDEIRINQERIHLYKSKYIYQENENEYKSCSLPVEIKKSMSIMNFERKFNKIINSKITQILPDKCKYVEYFGDKKLFVIEEKPSVRTLKMMLSVDLELSYLKKTKKINEPNIKEYFNSNDWANPTDNNIRKYILSIPYVVFIIMLDQNNQHQVTWIYFRLAPLVGKGDYLLKTPFCNVDESEQICLGDYATRYANTEQNAIKNIINTFWHGIYNQDYTYGLTKYQNEKVLGVASYVEWEVMTKNNPNFIYNVDWIVDRSSIGSKITYIKEIHTNSLNNTFFNKIKNAINIPIDTGESITQKLRNNSTNKQMLFYDITNGLPPRNNNEIYLHTGDPFYIKHEKAFCFISSFIGIKNSTEIEYIQVERNDGKFFKYKFTEKVRSFIIKQAKAIRKLDQAKLNNGTIIKSGDILILPDKTYREIEYIRRTPYNTIEVKFKGINYYNLENIEAELKDPNLPIFFKGTEIIKNKTYLVTFSVGERNTLISSFLKMKFEKFIIGSYSDELHILMKTINSENTLQLNNNFNVFDLNNVEVILDNPFFYNGRILKFIVSKNNNPNDIKVIKTTEGIAYDDKTCTTTEVDYEKLEKQILKDKKFHITGFNTNLDFSVGDTVVVANWDNPQDMLVTKEIIEIIIDKLQRKVLFKLKEPNGVISLVVYVDDNIIQIGKIRHIIKSFDKLNFSDKIKAKVVGICNFPKKDTNMIIGFLTDTGGQHLVLCSNGCTLWYEDVLKNFDIFTTKDKKWKKLSVAEIKVEKIKCQPGDLVFKFDTAYLIGDNCSLSYKKPFHEIHITYNTVKRNESDFRFNNFLAPRVSQKDLFESITNCNLVPNYLGTYKKVKMKFCIEFPIDKRSIINV